MQLAVDAATGTTHCRKSMKGRRDQEETRGINHLHKKNKGSMKYFKNKISKEK